MEGIESIAVVKIGGSLLEDSDRLDALLDDFHNVLGKKLLVHGGGPQANRLGRALGIEPTMVNGRRVTDAATLDLVTMVYAGLNSKRIVALLQKRGCNAVGLSGADGNVVRGTKRPVAEVDFGFVGDIGPQGIGVGMLSLLLEHDCVPVLNAITHDGAGTLLNTNADTIAGVTAVALSGTYVVDLLLILDRPGVLADASDNGSVIPRLTLPDIRKMKEEKEIAGGMLPKIDNALAALRGGVRSVRIGGEEMLRNGEAGTRIVTGNEA